MSWCWGNLDCLKKIPPIFASVIAKKRHKHWLSYLTISKVKGRISWTFTTGEVQCSKQVEVGKWKNIKLQLMVSFYPQWVTLHPRKQGLVFSWLPLGEFFKVNTHSDSISKQILKNKSHKFLINSCSSSWRCWVKCREKHHRSPLASWAACLNSDLIAHFIQSAEISPLLFRQCRPKGKKVGEREWDVERGHLVFWAHLLDFHNLFGIWPPATPRQPHLPIPLVLRFTLIGF